MDAPSPFWTDTPVCVLGGSGFLGSHLVGRLIERGARVRTLSLPSAGAPEPPREVEALHGDVRNPAAVRAAVAGARVVFLAAGPVVVGPSADRALTAHVDGVRRVIDALPAGARLVLTSSLVTVGATRTGEVLDEGAPFTLGRLRVSYVRAKRAAEVLALAAAGRGADVVVVNPGYLFGPDDPGPSVMGRVCVRFWRGRIPFASSGGISCADVRDVADGHLLAAQRGACGRRYILAGENVRTADLFARLAAVAGFHPRWLPALPGPVFTGIAAIAEARGRLLGEEPFPSLEHIRIQQLFWFASSERAGRELGYRCRPLDETLADTFAWHSAHARLVMRGFGRWWFRPAA
jgi:dihydroflavonol-4-reductase